MPSKKRPLKTRRSVPKGSSRRSAGKKRLHGVSVHTQYSGDCDLCVLQERLGTHAEKLSRIERLLVWCQNRCEQMGTETISQSKRISLLADTLQGFVSTGEHRGSQVADEKKPLVKYYGAFPTYYSPSQTQVGPPVEDRKSDASGGPSNERTYRTSRLPAQSEWVAAFQRRDRERKEHLRRQTESAYLQSRESSRWIDSHVNLVAVVACLALLFLMELIFYQATTLNQHGKYPSASASQEPNPQPARR